MDYSSNSVLMIYCCELFSVDVGYYYSILLNIIAGAQFYYDLDDILVFWWTSPRILDNETDASALLQNDDRPMDDVDYCVDSDY